MGDLRPNNALRLTSNSAFQFEFGSLLASTLVALLGPLLAAAERMLGRVMMSRAIAAPALTAFCAVACGSQPSPDFWTAPPGSHEHIEESAEVLEDEWFDRDERDWVLRNPKKTVQIFLHLPFGTGVRNAFCTETVDTHECSAQIYAALWNSVREDASPDLLAALDCQFEQIERVQIDPAGFHRMRIGSVLESIQKQIDSQTEAAGLCGQALRLTPINDPDLDCWTRAEVAKWKGQESLAAVLMWISWRNSFSVYHNPPSIDLRFSERCAWPEQPGAFE